MPELPVSVIAYLNRLYQTTSLPAYFLSDADGRLTAWGGELAAYGIAEPRVGELAGDQLNFLYGQLPLLQESRMLPYYQTDSGRMANIHLFPTPEGDCALLLDATKRGTQQFQIQQTSYDRSLEYRRLTKEIQKKEILLHCIVHDLAGPLMGIRGGFELLSKEPISESGRKFLDIGLRQASRQEALIKEILQTFAAEVASLESFTADPAKAPDALAAVRAVAESLASAFALNQVTLALNGQMDATKSWQVVGERSRLERVISNLTENALRHSPAGATVTIGLSDEGEHVLITIDDQGPGVPAELAAQLFEKFSQGKKGKGKVGLGLYFCRITVEHWGGAIGHEANPTSATGGSRFWFRLPKPQVSIAAPLSQDENAKDAQ